MLVDGDSDGLIDDPDDEASGGSFGFDFSTWGTGTVTVVRTDVLDIEEGGGSIQLFSGGAGGSLLATVAIPATGDGGLATVEIGVSGVDFMRITLTDSGAIDNIQIQVGTGAISGSS